MLAWLFDSTQSLWPRCAACTVYGTLFRTVSLVFLLHIYRIAIYLIWRLLGRSSPWFGYLQSLPESVDLPLTWDISLEGSGTCHIHAASSLTDGSIQMIRRWTILMSQYKMAGKHWPGFAPRKLRNRCENRSDWYVHSYIYASFQHIDVDVCIGRDTRLLS